MKHHETHRLRPRLKAPDHVGLLGHDPGPGGLLVGANYQPAAEQPPMARKRQRDRDHSICERMKISRLFGPTKPAERRALRGHLP
jgi:hypothetical protein